jgi:catechol 2,3-dioxygenase-like lactoylglutathione lyase family enzyme
MLSQSTIFPTLAVHDISQAREFYEDTLGLELVDEGPDGILYKSGEGGLFLYESPNAGQNPATSAAWSVDDVEACVEELKSKGVTFERYDDMPVQWQGDIAMSGDMRSAWFKDPDGNIFSVSNMH